MFQSILAEERIPAAVRVWYARLQMPVLRVALAEPEFFGSLEHPAAPADRPHGLLRAGLRFGRYFPAARWRRRSSAWSSDRAIPGNGPPRVPLVYDEIPEIPLPFPHEKGPTSAW
jgi:hypothetical protein